MELILPFPPTTGNHQYGVTRRGRRYTLPAVERYRAAVRLTFLGARLTRIGGPVCVSLHLNPPDARRRDGDNAEKVIFDALVRAGCIDDDSCIRTHTTTWLEPMRGGRVMVEITALGNEEVERGD
jgi:Holliday junction resolvase RusA-like endonuclease